MDEIESINAGHQKMLEWLKTVRFRKSLFGGVNEQDVWKKLDELNILYEEALVAERARYDTLLEQFSGSGQAKIKSAADERCGDG
ncbi:MAG: hypothetical protein LIO92_12830 [Clostridiales bacterium]|nr:hypothetical protein [Clostridiales bacterium]